MKHYLLLILVILITVRCGTKNPETVGSVETEVEKTAVTEEVKLEYAVCIWEKIGIKETPEEKGKYITSVNLAEKLVYLDESKTDEGNGKKREYLKVRLLDGKEGWVQKDFIVLKSRAAVFVKDIDMFSRPDLLSKTNKTFKKMDIVGVSEVQGEWSKITGKRSGGTWIDEGWVKNADLSYEDKDVAVSIYGKKAIAQTVKEKQIEELKKIIESKDFAGSVFLADLKFQYESLMEGDPLAIDSDTLAMSSN